MRVNTLFGDWRRIAVAVGVWLVGCGSVAGGNPAVTAPYQFACPVPVRSFEEVQRVRESESADEPWRSSDDAGVQVTAAMQAEIEVLVRDFLACSAAGEPLRVWSLYSDSYLARLMNRERGYDRVRYEMDLEPRPLGSEARPILRSLSPAMAHGDGHVVTRVVIWYPNLEREKDLEWRFVRVAGEWRIDEIDGEITFAVP